MSSLQRRIATLTHSTAGLIAELRELERLREEVRRARLVWFRSMQPKPRNGNGGVPRPSPEMTGRRPTPIRAARFELGVPKGIFPKGARQTIQQLSKRDADRTSPRDRGLRATLDSQPTHQGVE